MKKVIITLFSLGLIAVCPAICHGSEQHPRLYVSDSDHSAIVEKINRNDWARAAFSKIKSKIEPYADRHTTDPEWIVSRLAMYWKEGEHYTQCYLKKQAFDYVRRGQCARANHAYAWHEDMEQLQERAA